MVSQWRSARKPMARISDQLVCFIVCRAVQSLPIAVNLVDKREAAWHHPHHVRLFTRSAHKHRALAGLVVEAGGDISPYVHPGSQVSGILTPIAGINVTILGAHGIRSTNKLGADAFCNCSVVGKPRTSFATEVQWHTVMPTWNSNFVIKDFEEGDDIECTVMEKDDNPGEENFGKEDRVEGHEQLGTALMTSDLFFPKGYEGSVRLTHSGSDYAFLDVKINVIQGTINATIPNPSTTTTTTTSRTMDNGLGAVVAGELILRIEPGLNSTELNESSGFAFAVGESIANVAEVEDEYVGSHLRVSIQAAVRSPGSPHSLLERGVVTAAGDPRFGGGRPEVQPPPPPPPAPPPPPLPPAPGPPPPPPLFPWTPPCELEFDYHINVTRDEANKMAKALLSVDYLAFAESIEKRLELKKIKGTHVVVTNFSARAKGGTPTTSGSSGSMSSSGNSSIPSNASGRT